MTYTVKRGYSKREGCQMYGVYQDGKPYVIYRLFNRKNAALVAEWITMIEQHIIPNDEGISQIKQIINIDRRQYYGKNNN